MSDAAADPFWAGFGLRTCPDFRGKAVLEIGCGHGWRCIDAAKHGAARVVGVDPLEGQIAEARRTLASAALAEPGRVTFFQGTIEALPAETFDAVISESSLEHVMDVPALLAEVRRRLKPQGRFYLGFGPLYHAFDGDHGWLRAVLPLRRLFPWPWGHLILEKYAMRRLSALHGRTLTRTQDWPYLDLNRLSAADYERMFAESGLRIALARKNHVRSWKARLFAAPAALPVLSKYFTVNMYLVLERP
jgi:SAM-dependent methyltransferase